MTTKSRNNEFLRMYPIVKQRMTVMWDARTNILKESVASTFRVKEDGSDKSLWTAGIHLIISHCSPKHLFIAQSVLQQVHSLFQSKFSKVQKHEMIFRKRRCQSIFHNHNFLIMYF
jgi:hypothetical protein